jgi:5-methyltetrahydropteroyltriglutamate--homocysteine methyltransferase
MFPAFLALRADEIHVEMASRELAESDVVGAIAEVTDVAVGIVDVKSSWVEPPEEIAARTRHFLGFAPAERLALSSDCGLSQTARPIARQKLVNLVAGVALVREELGL